MADPQTANGRTGWELRSRVSAAGELEIALETVTVPAPKADEIVVQVQATPINPSDIGLLLGPADLSTLRSTGTAQRPAVTAAVPAPRLAALAARLDQSLPVGNEGAGVVVAAGDSDAARALVGRTVAMIGGAMYAQYRVIRAADCLVLPAGATAADGASCFVNPLTALGMTETMRREGHSALVHTAAASNLGQMLNRICLKDGIPLVNIVRSEEQAALLRGLGAKYVLDSTSERFTEQLADACAETRATIAFDAIGGGRLAGQILGAMEVAANRNATTYSRYGSSVHKQVYIYGALDLRPTELERSFGMAWGVGGWLLFPFLQKIGGQAAQALRQRVVDELKTTFASHYSATISLSEALQPDTVRAYARRATGEKFLIDPSRG